MANHEAGFPDIDYAELPEGPLIGSLIDPILRHQGLERTVGTGQGVVATLNWLLNERAAAARTAEVAEQSAHTEVVVRAMQASGLIPREAQ